MTPEEAVQVVTLIGELWPQADLNASGPRKTFYANALTVIPTREAAVKAVNKLFVTERWHPTPADVIDLASGVGKNADAQWQLIVQSASDLQANREPSVRCEDRLAVQTVWQLCGGMYGIPVNDQRQLERLRQRFVATYTEKQRDALTAVPQLEAPDE